MAILNLSVSDDLEAQFRRAASNYFGNKKGNLGKAAAEAFEFWIATRGKCAEADLPFENVGILLDKVIQSVADRKGA